MIDKTKWRSAIRVLALALALGVFAPRAPAVAQDLGTLSLGEEDEGETESTEEIDADEDAQETRAAAPDTEPADSTVVSHYRAGRNAYAAQNFQKALELLLPLAENGHVAAQYYVGQIYHFGFGGVEKDDAKAARWYSRAAEGGYVPALFKLGNLYTQAVGVERDLARAAAYYRRAADRGHTESIILIARFHEAGAVYDEDEGEARNWYRRAVRLGSEEAMLRLASNLMSTQRIPRDYRRAYTWLIVAAELGNREAIRLRAELSDRFIDEEIRRAEEWARSYLVRGRMPPRLEYDN